MSRLPAEVRKALSSRFIDAHEDELMHAMEKLRREHTDQRDDRSDEPLWVYSPLCRWSEVPRAKRLNLLESWVARDRRWKP